jgi:hypothetical protein
MSIRAPISVNETSLLSNATHSVENSLTVAESRFRPFKVSTQKGRYMSDII